MNRLTPAEEQVMLRLWKLEKASVKEIVELYQDQSPAYNTTSTIVRILEKKKFIRHRSKGRGYIYYPRVTREEYRTYLIEHLLTQYFDGDKQLLLSEVKEKE
jgi:BlaI family penicillinase repressor